MPPTIMNTNPITTPINRLVRIKINAISFQTAMKGQNKILLVEFISKSPRKNYEAFTGTIWFFGAGCSMVVVNLAQSSATRFSR